VELGRRATVRRFTVAWGADITNDPDRNYELYVELLQDDAHRARIQRNERRELELVCYGGDRIAIPAEWLVSVIQQFIADTLSEEATDRQPERGG
jgi:hypothetical protein